MPQKTSAKDQILGGGMCYRWQLPTFTALELVSSKWFSVNLSHWKHFVPSSNEPFIQEKLRAMPTTFIGAGSPALWCSVSPSGAAEHPDEMSSRWKLGQLVKSDGESQTVRVVLPSYPNSGWFSHRPVLWAAKPTTSFITKAAFLLGRDLENCSRTGTSVLGRWLTCISHSCFWNAAGNVPGIQHGGRGTKELRKAMGNPWLCTGMKAAEHTGRPRRLLLTEVRNHTGICSLKHGAHHF